jgi:hypothetical protein
MNVNFKNFNINFIKLINLTAAHLAKAFRLVSQHSTGHQRELLVRLPFFSFLSSQQLPKEALKMKIAIIHNTNAYFVNI